MISQYNLNKPTGIHNLTLSIQKRLTLKGFIITDHYNRLPDFTKDMAKWLADNNASAFGSMTATYEQWLSTIKAEWSPSMVVDSNGLRSGVEALS